MSKLKEEIKELISAIEKNSQNINNLMNISRQIQIEPDEKNKIFSFLYDIEDNIFYEKQYIINILYSLGDMPSSVKFANLKSLSIEKETALDERMIKINPESPKDFGKLADLAIENRKLFLEIRDIKEKLNFEISHSAEQALIRSRLQFQINDLNKELEKIKDKYDELLIDSKEYYERTKLKPNEIVVDKDKIKNTFEIIREISINENLLKFLEYETKKKIEIKDFVEFDNDSISRMLKLIRDLEQKNNKNENALSADSSINLKPVILSENVKNIKTEYKKPKTNKHLNFPSSIIPIKSK